MIAKDFLKALANGDRDVVQVLLDILEETGAPYCLIGGLAVNAYAEPVVSLDLDIVVVADHMEAVSEAARAKGMQVKRFEHSVNLTMPGSDLRIQLQIDARYHDFPSRRIERDVLGYRMWVAAVEDVLQGKLWAYADETRRPSKRQKDLADILRLVEADPHLKDRVPPSMLRGIE